MPVSPVQNDCDVNFESRSPHCRCTAVAKAVATTAVVWLLRSDLHYFVLLCITLHCFSPVSSYANHSQCSARRVRSFWRLKSDRCQPRRDWSIANYSSLIALTLVTTFLLCFNCTANRQWDYTSGLSEIKAILKEHPQRQDVSEIWVLLPSYCPNYNKLSES